MTDRQIEQLSLSAEVLQLQSLTVEFEFFSANTLAELDSVIPVSVVYPTDTTAQSYDIGDELISAGQVNYMPFLRVRAKLSASSDSLSTPTFVGWSMEFHCEPIE